MALDISGLTYFMPVFSFIFIFVIVFALLTKTKLLGENNWINGFISFVIAFIFATTISAREYVQTITPWFVVLVVALFFILIIVGLSQQKISDIIKPGFVWVFIILLIAVFLIAAVKVFPIWRDVIDFFVNEGKIAGAIILLVIAGLAAWVITKK